MIEKISKRKFSIVFQTLPVKQSAGKQSAKAVKGEFVDRQIVLLSFRNRVLYSMSWGSMSTTH